MKKTINGKRYNTETAECITYAATNRSCSDFCYCRETLYRKKTGEFFLHGEGHAMSKYAEKCSDGSWGWGEEIVPLTIDQAIRWLQKNGEHSNHISNLINELTENRR